MNFNFAEKINPSLEDFNFDAALQIAEAELKLLPVTAFHAVCGRSLVYGAQNLATWIDDFYHQAKKRCTACALYFELNEFDSNTKDWFISGFAYENCELDADDNDWLSDWATDSHVAIGPGFYISTFPDLQAAFATVRSMKERGEWNTEMEDAKDWCEQIILIRFMELMRASHLHAKQNSLSWSDIPIFFAMHDYDFILKSE